MQTFLGKSVFIEDSLIANYMYLGVIALVIASFAAGYVDSIAGGGGLISVPIYLLVGFDPHFALGQNKLVSTIGATGAIRNFIKNKSIIWKIVPFGIVASLIGGHMGSKLVLLLDTKFVYYIILFLVPAGLLITLCKSNIKQRSSETIKFSVIATVITCFIVGLYDGFFGPGAGSIFIMSLYIINRIPLLNASATSKVLNFSSNVGALIGFAIAGKIILPIGVPMIIGSFLGNHFGSLHAIKTNGDIIKKILIIVVCILVITIIVQLFLI
jgi:uncharacterized membrane protein YfcA